MRRWREREGGGQRRGKVTRDEDRVRKEKRDRKGEERGKMVERK